MFILIFPYAILHWDREIQSFKFLNKSIQIQRNTFTDVCSVVLYKKSGKPADIFSYLDEWDGPHRTAHTS